MSLPDFMRRSAEVVLKTIEMHTTGEPTRILYNGFPDIPGTLLEQRASALANHDHIRRALICEPRGHKDMYGAILRPRTELVDAGKAAVGVLFMTNEGYSTMCGHATIAVSRFLVDSLDSSQFHFIRKDKLIWRDVEKEVVLPLHLPCGLVEVTVPFLLQSDKIYTDTSRPIHYQSIPSFAAGIGIEVPIPQHLRWTQLGNQDSINVDVTYGGAFFLVVPTTILGFAASLKDSHVKDLSEATKNLKAAFNLSPELREQYLYHPDHKDLSFLYSVIVTDTNLGTAAPGTSGSETGLCFFADQQIDRSPTGSGVQARVALAYAKGQRGLNQAWTYHSLVSEAFEGNGGFVGEPIQEVQIASRKGVIVRVSGQASYTGSCEFMIEKDDSIGKGFWL